VQILNPELPEDFWTEIEDGSVLLLGSLSKVQSAGPSQGLVIAPDFPPLNRPDSDKLLDFIPMSRTVWDLLHFCIRLWPNLAKNIFLLADALDKKEGNRQRRSVIIGETYHWPTMFKPLEQHVVS
jgi:hypothetical protein